MKILQVTGLFSPVHGGSAEVPYQLSKELVKRGHQVTVYTSDYRLGPEYISSIPEIEVCSFKTWFKTWSSWTKFYITPSLVKKVKEEIKYFDVVHMHTYRSFQNIVVHYYARKYHIPYVLQAYEWLGKTMLKRRLKRVYDNLCGYRLLKDASKLIAVTEREAEEYRNMGASKDKIEIIPYAIDLSEYNNLPQKGEFRRKYSIEDSEKVILYLGRINKTKGLDLLAGAFAGLSKELDDAKLVVVGPDNGYLPAFKKLVADLEISDKVLFTGPLYEQERLKAYVGADVYVLPSFYETFGITALEALACGTPVVVTDQCGIAEATNRQALLAVPCDKEKLQNAILHMLRDDKVRKQFGECGELLIRERFNWSRVAAEVESVYSSCLSLNR